MFSITFCFLVRAESFVESVTGVRFPASLTPASSTQISLAFAGAGINVLIANIFIQVDYTKFLNYLERKIRLWRQN